MMLIDWLTANGRTQTWLATQVGLSVGQTSRVVRGEQPASWEVAERIRQISGGLVMPNDLHEQRRRWLAERAPSQEQNMNIPTREIGSLAA